MNTPIMDKNDETNDSIQESDMLQALENELPLLLAMRHFATQAVEQDWFSCFASALDEQTRVGAQDFCTAMGEADAALAPLADWDEAYALIEESDLHDESAAWEGEVQARTALLDTAILHASDEGLNVVLSFIAAQLDDVLRQAALAALYDAGFDEEDAVSIDAPIGAAQQAAYGAALVYGLDAIGALDEERAAHPLWLKYQLFALGRWPLGFIGRSFYLL